LFLDISTNAQTKEDFLSKGCQARIRGYLAKAESGLKSSEQNPEIISMIMTEFRALLKYNGYNGHYFNRKSTKITKICNEDGVFLCEGRFDKDTCKYNVDKSGDSNQLQLVHEINPYESCEARIMFSTWNLDHV
jgi:DNA fragmentation factor beta subunit